MTRGFITLSGLLVLFFLMPAAAGQGRDRSDRERRGGDLLMRVLDKDGDGKLSAQEMENAGQVLMALDADGDGEVTLDELRSGRADRRRGGDRPGRGNQPGRNPSQEETARSIQRGASGEYAAPPSMVLIPGGAYEMGDHHDLGGREHGNDEVPIHEVRLDPFEIGVFEITNEQYCGFLNAALSREWIDIKNGIVYPSEGKVLYCDTNDSDPASSIVWDGRSFFVIQGWENHPAVCIRWHGAASYCNWLSMEQGHPVCYDLSTWECNFLNKGFRLPTEAEWEYAGRGGCHDPYFIFPWGDESDRSKANWPNSGDPYETGPYPWTTPVGFYNGKRHLKSDFGWPGRQENYQTSDGSNGYGLYDVAGNVWEWVNDWYGRDYYRASVEVNPKGPSSGAPMQDGLPYRALRSGNWYNGEDGHSRVSNRNPSYYRGPDDPDHRWYHIGFRVARSGVEEPAPEKKTARGGGNPSSAQERDSRPPRSERGDRRDDGGQGRQQGPAPREGSESVDRQIGLVTNTEQAWPGYTLFAPKHFLFTYLIDNEGHMINSWTSQYEPGQSVYLLENGHLLHCCFTKGSGGIGGGEGGRLEEYDWDGNLVWEYWCVDDSKMMHHDVELLPNGNILAMIVEKKAYDECIAAGFPPDVLRDDYLLPEYIVELEKKGKNDAKIVWEWHVWDHLIQDNDPKKPNYGKPSDHPERIWVEVNGRGAPAFWNHMNSIDYNRSLDQIMLSVRGCSELWIIDHSTTTEEAKGSEGGRYGKGGDLLYRWGNPAAYGRGTASDQQLFEQHDTQWISKGCPGEGNILVFNNGLGRSGGAADREARSGRARGGRSRGESYSSVDEIVPPMDKKGNYLLERGKVFGPAKPKWSYTAANKTDFFSGQISGCQRLPNGNTLICAGTSGEFFEVTPAGKKTWEYVCPVDGNGPMEQGDSIPLDHRGHAMNAVFKIERYPLDYPAFKGKDLTPKGKVTGSEPENVPENLSRGQRRGGGGERRGGEGSGERRDAGGRGRDRGGDQRRSPQEKDIFNKAANDEAPSDGLGRSIAGRFTVSSPVVEEDEALPMDFTGDGDGISMPVEWSGAPTGTRCFALSLWHVARDREKSYWVVYDIPADVHSLPEDVRGIGTVGYNDQGRSEYMPMRSKGSGIKEYNLSIYALSAKPEFNTDKVTRAELLEAIENITLAEDTLTYTYERIQSGNESARGEGERRGGERARGQRGRGGQKDRSQNRGRDSDEAEIFHTDVPEHPFDIILGRPTANSVTLRVLAYHEVEGAVSFGTDEKALTLRSDKYVFKKGKPLDVVLDGLKPDTRYYYRFSEDKETRTFHTQRSPGSMFTFTITADSHLDRNTSPELYATTLRNALADRPDFHIDLGDTFMTDKYRNDYREALRQYLAQRYYFGLLCHSAPLFLVLGNHDGETGWRSDMSDWSNRMRTMYFPNPIPDGFYSGNATKELENYYAWEWGDALFMVLDPFWYTNTKSGGDDGWSKTLGIEQYQWLKNTLMQSDKRFKFVFIHHLVGGHDRNSRGGIEAAPYFEWGGLSRDGSNDFSAQRPNWEMPIHDLLKKNRVSIVFHGHDHFFAKQELDGVVYQLVPQPGHPGGNSSRSAEEYGYVNGEILDGSGYMRVTVSKKEMVAEFIRSAHSDDEQRGHRNGEIVCSYTLN